MIILALLRIERQGEIMTFLFIVLLVLATLCAFMMSHTDWRKRIIPDVYLWPFMLIGLSVVTYFQWPVTISESIIAACFGYALSIGTGWIFTKCNKKDPIGLGDVKLITAGGIWAGPVGLAIALGVSCIIGYIWGMIKKQKHIPFAPFFFIGLIIALISLYFLI